MISVAVLLHPIPDLTQLSISRSQDRVFEKAPRLIDPADRIALEAGLTLQDRSLGEVTAVCAAGSEEERLLREPLALGAKQAVLLEGWREGPQPPPAEESFQLAQVLAAALGKLQARLILCGPGQMGPRLAQALEADFAIASHTVDLEGVECCADDRRLGLPAVVAVLGGFTPRMANPLKIMKAAKAEILRWNPAALGLDMTVLAAGMQLRRIYLPID